MSDIDIFITHAKNGDLAQLQALVANGFAQPEANNNAALMEAIVSNKPQVVLFLLSLDKVINGSRDWVNLAFFSSIKRNNQELIDVLCDLQNTHNLLSPQYADFFIHSAIAEKNLYFLSKALSINSLLVATIAGIMEILTRAVISGDLAILKLLLNNADIRYAAEISDINFIENLAANYQSIDVITDVINDMADDMRQSGNYESAIKIYITNSQPPNNNQQSLYNLATAYSETNQHQLAIEAYETIIENCKLTGSTENMCRAMLGMGFSYRAIGELELAKQWLMKLIHKFNPGEDFAYYKDALINLGELHKLTNNYKKAKEFFTKAAKPPFNDPYAMYELSKFYADTNTNKELLLLLQATRLDYENIISEQARSKLTKKIKAIIADDIVYGQLEDTMTCPITHELIIVPVTTADGYTYERAAITRWLEEGNTISPMTREPLANNTLTYNDAVSGLIGYIIAYQPTSGTDKINLANYPGFKDYDTNNLLLRQLVEELGPKKHSSPKPN